MGKFILSPEIKQMLVNFHRISGLRVGLYDMEQRILADYPPQEKYFDGCRFCEKCKTCSGVYYGECQKCDTRAVDYMCTSGKPYVYKCHLGFMEAVIPIKAGGEPYCYLMIGQVRSKEEVLSGKKMTVEMMARLLDQYSVPMDRYPPEKALSDYEIMPCIDLDTFKAYVYFLEICAQKIYDDEYVRRAQPSVSRALITFVKKNVYNDVTISDFAKSVGLSSSYLSHSIAKEMGTTFTKYLLMCRIEEAKRILRTTDMSVKNISILLKYNDVSYFVRQFKKVTGMTCTEYRELKTTQPSKEVR